MDGDRLQRFVIPDWALLLSIGFHYWALGGDFKFLEGLEDFEGIVAAVGALGSSPFLGLVAHVFAAGFLFNLRGRRQHFMVPRSELEFRSWVDSLAQHTNDQWSMPALVRAREAFLRDPHAIEGSSEELSGSDEERTLYLHANRVFWTRAHKNIQDLVVRGWTLYWSIMNSLFGILLGAAIAIVIQAYSISLIRRNSATMKFIVGRFLSRQVGFAALRWPGIMPTVYYAEM